MYSGQLLANIYAKLYCLIGNFVDEEKKKKRKLKSKGCIAQAETEYDAGAAVDAHPRERVAS